MLYYLPLCIIDAVDFTSVTAQLIFQPSQADVPQCEDVPILEDTILETNEFFTVELSTTDPVVILSPQSATVTITDNDSMYIVPVVYPNDHSLTRSFHRCDHWL